MNQVSHNTPENNPAVASIFASLVPTAKTINPHCNLCAAHKNCDAFQLFDGIPCKQLNRVVRSHSIIKHQHIFYAGGALSTLYVVKSGVFKTYMNSEAGDERVMGFHMPGDVLGVDALAYRTHSLSAVALEASTVCAIAINQLEALAHQYSPNWMVTQVYQQVLRERHILELTARKYSTDSRVALFLLDMSARQKAQGYSEREFKLSMPQRDIAHYLDMALETVSRVFARLQDSGVLVIKRPYVTINNLETLQALAEVQPPTERLIA